MYISVKQFYIFKNTIYFVTLAKYKFLRIGSMLDRQLTWFLVYVEIYGSHPKAHVS